MILEKADRPTMYFIGVTTGSSSIMKIFPEWVKALGRGDTVIKGIDIAIHERPEVYREVVEFIKNDPLSLGALVTTHKLDLYAAASDLFDWFDPCALQFGELSSISKRHARGFRRPLLLWKPLLHRQLAPSTSIVLAGQRSPGVFRSATIVTRKPKRHQHAIPDVENIRYLHRHRIRLKSRNAFKRTSVGGTVEVMMPWASHAAHPQEHRSTQVNPLAYGAFTMRRRVDDRRLLLPGHPAI